MTALAEQETEPCKPISTARFLLVGILGLVVTVGVIVCHGCHAGDHDDELRMPTMRDIASDRP